MQGLTKITEICKEYGLTTRTLRYYEEVGLIHSIRQEEYAYRLFDEENCRRIREVAVLRKLDLSIKNILEIYQGDDPNLLPKLIRQKVRQIDEQIGTLTELKELVQLFLKNMGQGTLFSAMERAQTEKMEPPKEDRFDFTRFVELCGKIETQSPFFVVSMGEFEVDDSPLAVGEEKVPTGGYLLYDEKRRRFGRVLKAAGKKKKEENVLPAGQYATTVFAGEGRIQQALTSFGHWLKNSSYQREEGKPYCLVQNLGYQSTQDGRQIQLALSFPVVPLQEVQILPAQEDVQRIQNNLMEGFKMFNGVMNKEEFVPFSMAKPMDQIQCFALPEARVIGKTIRLPLNFTQNPIPDMWQQMCAEGDFDKLEQLPRYREDLLVGLNYRDPEDDRYFYYTAGVLCRAGCEAPEGYRSFDLKSTLAVLGRFGEKQSKIIKGLKKMDLEEDYKASHWDLEIYFSAECNGPAAGKKHGPYNWRILLPVCKKIGG